MPSIDGESASSAALYGPYSELAFSAAPSGKSTCEILHADEKLRDKLR